MTVTNALAYYYRELITAIKSSIALVLRFIFSQIKFAFIFEDFKKYQKERGEEAREGERERERDKERGDKERGTKRDGIKREGQRERDIERGTKREGQRERDKERGTKI
jgi:hypothetical protein